MPDIDLDFPRDIREKLIPRVHERYGADRSALVAAFPTYRPRGAVRDLGKALGAAAGGDRAGGEDGRLPRATAEIERDVDRRDRRPSAPPRRLAALLIGSAARRWGCPATPPSTPGGMVISTRPLVDVCPVVPAAMEGRQIVQWDKDSCADAGFLKIDLLGLGMLSAVERCVEEVGRDARRAARPLADPARRPRDLRVDPRRRDHRRLPDREPGPDADAAAHPAPQPRRPHRPGGARPARPDPGRRRPPLHRAPQAAARGPGLRDPLRPPAAGAGPAARRSARSSTRSR